MPGEEGKEAQESKEIPSNKKKQGHPKKQGKEDQGPPQGSIWHRNRVTWGFPRSDPQSEP